MSALMRNITQSMFQLQLKYVHAERMNQITITIEHNQ